MRPFIIISYILYSSFVHGLSLNNICIYTTNQKKHRKACTVMKYNLPWNGEPTSFLFTNTFATECVTDLRAHIIMYMLCTKISFERTYNVVLLIYSIIIRMKKREKQGRWAANEHNNRKLYMRPVILPDFNKPIPVCAHRKFVTSAFRFCFMAIQTYWRSCLSCWFRAIHIFQCKGCQPSHFPPF